MRKSSILLKKVLIFCQANWADSSPAAELGKLFQLCFMVAEGQITQSLPRGKIKAMFYLFALQSSHLLRLWVSSRKAEVLSSLPHWLLLSTSPTIRAGGEGRQPVLWLLELQGPSPSSSSSPVETTSWFHLALTTKSLQVSRQKPSPWGCFGSWHTFCNFHFYLASLRPSSQVGSQPPCRELSSISCLMTGGTCSSKQQSHSYAAHKGASAPACFLLLFCLFSSTAILFGTDQDLAADRSNIRAIAQLGGTYSIFWALFTLFVAGRGNLSLQSLIFWRAQQQPIYLGPQPLVLLLRETFGCAGRLLWGGPRNLGLPLKPKAVLNTNTST